MHIPIINNQPFPFPVGKAVCVGRNYAAHAQELNNEVPSKPLLFHKPGTAVCPLSPSFTIPKDLGEVHHELEIAVLIGQQLSNADLSECSKAIVGIGLALDLTLRDVQTELKSKGHPWEMAKAFDNSCPISEFVAFSTDIDLTNLSLTLERNGVLQQQGTSRDMIFPVLPLLSYISKYFTLNPGDIVLTGTPAGVGPLLAGDKLQMRLGNFLSLSTAVA